MSAKKKLSTGLIVRVLIIVLIGGAAVVWKLNRRQQVIKANEATAAENSAIVAEEASLSQVPSAELDVQPKTAAMLKADEMAAELAVMEQEVADAKKRLAEMDDWLKTFLETKLVPEELLGDPEKHAEMQKTYDDRLKKREEFALQTAKAEEEMIQFKVEYTNLKMDIATGSLNSME